MTPREIVMKHLCCGEAVCSSGENCFAEIESGAWATEIIAALEGNGFAIVPKEPGPENANQPRPAIRQDGA